MSKLHKTDLIRSIAQAHGTTQDNVQATIDAFLDGITAQIEGGTDVTLNGFGTFKRHERAARKGRNPSNGESIDIAASSNMTFKQAKAIKDRLNG